MIFKFLVKNKNKLAFTGVSLIILAIIGIWVGNTCGVTLISDKNNPLWGLGLHNYKYGYLVSPSLSIGLIGVIVISPLVIDLIFRLFKLFWRIVKRDIYEVFYEATKPIEDAKKNETQ